MTAIRPQCSRIAMSYLKESSYGSAIADASVNDYMFEPFEPIILDVTQERINDADWIKGHEFPVDSDKDIIIAQNVSMPFSFPACMQLLGYFYSLICDDYSVSGGGPYTHLIKCGRSLCGTNDQPYSGTFLLAAEANTATTYYQVKGACLNELTLSVDGGGWVKLNGTFITDGSLTAKAAQTFPASSTPVAADFLYGNLSVFSFGAVGSPSQDTTFRGCDFTINRDLDLADGRSKLANSAYLSCLRVGKPTTSLTVRVDGYLGSADQYYTYYLAGTACNARLAITRGSYSITIDLRTCKLTNIKPSYDGPRGILELTFSPFYDATNTCVAKVTVVNSIARYLT